MISQRIPLDGLQAELDAVAKEATTRDMKPLLKQFGVFLSSIAKRCFHTGTAPDGSGWAPVKIRARGPGKPLRDRGLLMASMGAREPDGGPGPDYRQIGDRFVEQGTNLDYAATHQNGAIIRPKKAKALAIPLTPEAYRAQTPRRMGALFMIWPKGETSGGLYKRKQGKGKNAAVKLVKHFLLLPYAKIPARPFVGINEADADKMVTMAAVFFSKGA